MKSINTSLLKEFWSECQNFTISIFISYTGQNYGQQKQDKNMDNKQQAIMKPTKPKPKPIESAELGDVLLCKMKGFCAWPAFVADIQNGRITVEFFGDHTRHTTTMKNFYKFNESSETILANLQGRKNPLYSKSVLEAERVLGVPEKHSILNKIN